MNRKEDLVKRTPYALFALAPVLALGYLACVGSPGTESDEILAEDDAAMIAPDPALVGTYRNPTLRIGALSLLVLKLDGTYHRGRVIACAATPCPPVQDDGHYTLSARGGETYLSLSPDDTEVVDRYRYGLARGTLRLIKLGEPSAMSLQKTENESWCAEPEDCSLQRLPVGPCAGEWQCASDTCSYSCRPTLPAE